MHNTSPVGMLHGHDEGVRTFVQRICKVGKKKQKNAFVGQCPHLASEELYRKKRLKNIRAVACELNVTVNGFRGMWSGSAAAAGVATGSMAAARAWSSMCEDMDVTLTLTGYESREHSLTISPL
eukprot:81641-Chlamydomonas_euryale.AAC.28